MDAARKLREDRAMRDASLAIFKSDLAHLRADLSVRGIGGRLADRVGDGAMDMIDEAVVAAEENRGKLAAVGFALVVWFARHPILSAIRSIFGYEDDEDYKDDRGTGDSYRR